MKIIIHELPGSKMHSMAAEVTDWFGARRRFYRCLLTGNIPGGEWVSMDTTSQSMPSRRLTKKLKEAASKHRARIR